MTRRYQPRKHPSDREQEQLLDEMQCGSCIIPLDEYKDHAYRHGTRLDRSRILQTDEDNIGYTDDY